jgi:dihydroorotase
MNRIVICHGRVVDPSQNLDRVMNLLIEADRVAAYDVPRDAAEMAIDATGCIVCPGLIDLCVQLREPGHEEDETIATGAAAAIAGGFTTIACIPNTDPPIDTQASVEFVQLQAARAAQCRVEVLACVSKQREGAELAELGTLAAAGAVGFTDATSPIFNAELMRRALEYSQMFDRPILNRPEVPDLNRGGIMHEGLLSTVLGLTGMPAAAEDVMCSRDIRLAEATGGPIHLLGVSTEGTVELIRQAKSRGLPVSASLFAPNLAADENALRTFDSNWKLNPPLRSQRHWHACLQGLRDGTIDIITSGHAPRATEKKMDVLDAAPFGMVGLETTLGLVGKKLVEPGHLDWPAVIAMLSTHPAKLLGLAHRGTLAIGAWADITVFDPRRSWTVDPRTFRSKSSNNPLSGWTLLGQPTHVLVAGRMKLGGG